MRKVDSQMITAIRNHLPFSKGNRQVIQHDNGSTSVYFHGHLIAGFGEASLFIDNCGYWTATTKQILNELLREFCDATLYQHKFDWFVQERSQEREYTGGQLLVSYQ